MTQELLHLLFYVMQNALLDHLRISMMVYTGTPAMYISIAAPENRESVPISFGLNPEGPQYHQYQHLPVLHQPFGPNQNHHVVHHDAKEERR